MGDSVDWTTPSPPPGGAPTGGPPVGLWVIGDLLSASGEIQWPPAGRFVAAYGEDLVAANICPG